MSTISSLFPFCKYTYSSFNLILRVLALLGNVNEVIRLCSFVLVHQNKRALVCFTIRILFVRGKASSFNCDGFIHHALGCRLSCLKIYFVHLSGMAKYKLQSF